MILKDNSKSLTTWVIFYKTSEENEVYNDQLFVFFIIYKDNKIPYKE